MLLPTYMMFKCKRFWKSKTILPKSCRTFSCIIFLFVLNYWRSRFLRLKYFWKCDFKYCIMQCCNFFFAQWQNIAVKPLLILLSLSVYRPVETTWLNGHQWPFILLRFPSSNRWWQSVKIRWPGSSGSKKRASNVEIVWQSSRRESFGETQR